MIESGKKCVDTCNKIQSGMLEYVLVDLWYEEDIWMALCWEAQCMPQSAWGCSIFVVKWFTCVI